MKDFPEAIYFMLVENVLDLFNDMLRYHNYTANLEIISYYDFLDFL